MRIWALVAVVGLAMAGVAFGQGEPPKVETSAPPAVVVMQGPPPAGTAQGTAGAGVTADPALWIVTNGKATVYLFGTVHVMKPDVHWETPKVAAALKSSSTLYLEIANTGADAAEALQPLMISLGMDAEHPLSTKISKDDVALLDTEMKKMGQGEAQLEPMQPWLVYVMLSVLPPMEAGYDPANGIDPQLQKQAAAQGKPVKGFETADQQLHVLADFPQPEQVALLHETIQELPKAVEQTNEMVADWEHGDVAAIAKMENEDLETKHPDLYKKLLVDRNQAISAKIAALLKDPATGTVFVAVGAAHLAGADSIQKDLEKQGFASVRVE
jgi:uncharacterized protein YbaP (TraB family)